MTRPTPPRREEINRLEPYAGLGLERIQVVGTAEEARQAFEELQRHQVLGFDTESKPTFRKHERSAGPHVLQFATPERAYLFQAHRAEGRGAIAALLEAEGIAKVGFGLRDDLRFIAGKFGIEPRGIVDLNDTFGELGYRNQVGARTAIAMLFGRRFQKSKSTTTSDWSAHALTEKQLLYAANDAYAALQVYLALDGGLSAGGRP
jgi:ribonuclease D